MKKILLLIFCISTGLRAEPLSYYQSFFDKKIDITHDPEYPTFIISGAKNNLYQVTKTSDNSAVGVVFSFSLRENGKYSFFMVDIKHRWKKGKRQLRFGKCTAYNGKWSYLDGSLYLDQNLKLIAEYRDGKNLLKPIYLDIKAPAGTEGIDIFLNKTGEGALGGIIKDEQNFSCKFFFFPFWLTIPESPAH